MLNLTVNLENRGRKLVILLCLMTVFKD